jgi:hypothetical protein
MMKALFVLLIVFIALLDAKAQKIKGRVVDAASGKPMPFVNIRFNDGNSGTATDIDGKFSINGNDINTLKFSFVGYKDTVIAVPKSMKTMFVKLTPEITELGEVEILPGVNPAHRIIKAAVKNRKRNNPENLNSFKYVSYNKMIFTADPNPVFDSLSPDTLQKKMLEFMEKHHIFIMESATKRYFYKGKSYEKVLSTRVSGFSDPFFVMLATQFQSFSFYKPHFNLLDKNYINPIAPGTLKKYFFLIKDTVYQDKDTVFVISFRPYKGKNFDGLKGVIYINSDGYAVQNVIAEPFSQDAVVSIKIQQQYKKVDGKQWFPTQLNTTLEFNTVNINNMPMIGIGTTYLDSIEPDCEVPKRIFRNGIVLETAPDAAKNAESLLTGYRIDSLSVKEKNTYSFIDSIGRENKFDKKFKTYMILMNSGIPIGKFSIPLDRFFRYNSYEKFRLGLGLQTNERMSRYFTAGGYGAWATGDKQWKYGGFLEITPVPVSDFKIKLTYKDDLEESGADAKFSEISLFDTEAYREFLINKMNRSAGYSANVEFRTFKYFLWSAGFVHSSKQVNDDYTFLINKNEYAGISSGDFVFSEMRLGLKFAYGEKFIRNGYQKVSLGTNYPVVHLRYTRGLPEAGSDFEFNRVDIQLDKSFLIRFAGESKFTVKAGFVDRALPWYMLYNAPASYAEFYIFSANSFMTMRLNEFVSDRYASLFWQHNFGQLLFKNKYFSPDIVVVNNMGWGDLSEINRHKNISFNTMEKGFFESGLLLEKIIKSGISNIGFGVFYRYGPYGFDRINENFSYMMTIGWNF